MTCQNEQNNECQRRGNGYVFIIVLYILLAIIIGTVIY
ncbi:MAG: sporulation protein YjcZ [Bacilli bacterium]|nr:sporulation protein YjcZ [Bacilli bacterium]